MTKKKYYLVYKTTNLVNGKIYIGKHETNNLDDGYLGSGNLLRRAIKKYGEENFKREILFECSSREEMNAKEAELVNEEFLKRDDVYNLKQGGEGGWDFINESRKDKQVMLKMANSVRQKIKLVWKYHAEKYKNIHKLDPMAFKDKHHTEESKRKIGEKNKCMIGERNSCWGTVWIYNESLEQNKKVKKEELNDFLNQGWKLGRKMSFKK